MARRQSIGAAALIHRQGTDGTEWFARWNQNWDCFHVVGGHKWEGESFRECMLRELGEELGLSNGQLLVVPAEPVHMATYAAWSERAGEVTDYTLALFAVSASPDLGSKAVASQQEVRWITEDEILAGVCDDGLRVSDTFKTLLDLVNWLRQE